MLAWGAKVSPKFRGLVRDLGEVLGVDPSWLMACMAFETGETFRADIRNAAGSGAVGLIQFMPPTAAALGTSTEALSALSPEAQLSWVGRYFRPWKGRLHSLGDVYGAILWPGMIGRADDWVVFRAGGPKPALYLQNRGLDLDRDGAITKAEIVSKVARKLERGLLPQFVEKGEENYV